MYRPVTKEAGPTVIDAVIDAHHSAILFGRAR